MQKDCFLAVQRACNLQYVAIFIFLSDTNEDYVLAGCTGPAINLAN